MADTLSRAALSDESGMTQLRVRCISSISCASHTDGPVTKPCQTGHNESDQRGDYERPILNDTEESGCGWLALPKE